MDASAAVLPSSHDGGRAQELLDDGRVAAAGAAGDASPGVWSFFRGRTFIAAAFPILLGIYCIIGLGVGADVPERAAYVGHGHLLTWWISFLSVCAALLILTVDDGRQIYFRFFRSRTLSAGAFLILCGTSSILSTAVPDLSADGDHLILSFSFLTIGAALVSLAMAGDGTLPAHYSRLVQKMHDAVVRVVAAAAAQGQQAGGLPFRGRTFCAAAFFILWGAASIIHGAVPDINANPDHLLLCFVLHIVGVVLLLLAVAAPTAAARLEGRLMEVMP